MIELLVRRLQGFGALRDEDKAALSRLGSDVCSVAAQTDLVRQGDAPRGVFLVLEGFACRYKTCARGLRQITAFLLAGDFCDVDVALVSRMDHAVGTLSDCKVVRIAPDTIGELMERPPLARALRMATLAETANAREWIVNIGRRHATERIAHLICELYERLDAVGLTFKGGFQMPLTQTDLADATGMSYVHMNRSIRDLREAGLIEIRHRRLTVLDLAALRRRADFQPDYLHLQELVA